MTMYEAEVLADSISEAGVRLTSIAVTYPHAVHKDMLRHRNQSRVVESFRARPTELLIDALEAGEAFTPDVFAQRVKGMQQGEAIKQQETANHIWVKHIEHCLFTARAMSELDIAKQQCNFALQDLCPLVEIITATDWENFRALRLDLDDDGNPRARPEVYKTAKAITDALDASAPRELNAGEWHLPLIYVDDYKAHETTDEELAHNAEIAGTWAGDWLTLAQISAGRCARVSYDKHRDPEPHEKSIARANMLLRSGHMSPFEQAARPMTLDDFADSSKILSKLLIPGDQVGEIGMWMEEGGPGRPDFSAIFCGNFRGWVSYRKLIPNEHRYDLLQQATAIEV